MGRKDLCMVLFMCNCLITHIAFYIFQSIQRLGRWVKYIISEMYETYRCR